MDGEITLNNPVFSVIIPTHNRAIELERCLNSLTLQSFKNFEVIVVDDGSTENIFAVLKKFKNSLNLRSFRLDEASGGAARPRNRGIKEACGEWIAFLDSDDWWYPHKLERVKEYLIFSDIIFHDLDLEENGKRFIFKSVNARTLRKPVFIDLVINHNGLVTSGVTVKKSIIDMVGGFEEIELEDYDLWLKISLITDNFYHIREKLGCYWIGKANTTQNNKREIKRVQKIFNKHLNSIPLIYFKEALAAKRYIQGRIWDKMDHKSLATKAYDFALYHGSSTIRAKAFFHLTKKFFIK